jgi:hypothetical protein
MPHNWDETWRWLLALGGVIGIYRLAVFLNDRARGAKSRARHPTSGSHWLMLPLIPFMPFIWAGGVGVWIIGTLALWILRKALPLVPVRDPPVVASDDRVRRKDVGPTRYPFWLAFRGQAGWVRVMVEITADGAYRAHRIIDASPPGLFDGAVAQALGATTYETVDASPLPADFETLYRFVPPPPRSRPGRSIKTASQIQA